MAVPPPEPEREPAAGPGDWVHRNLFRSAGDGIVTVLAGALVLYVTYRGVRYVFVTGRWDIVRVNLKLFMVGRYPSDELWRVSVAIAVIAFTVGVVAGFITKRRVITGRVDPEAERRPWWRAVVSTAGRLWPLVTGVVLVLSMTTTIGPWLTVAGAIVGAVAGRLVGPLLPGRSGPYLTLAVAAVAIALLLFLRQPYDVTDWGGLMLNLVLAVFSI